MNTMDIQAASIDLAQARLFDRVGASLLSSALKNMEGEGAEVIKLLDSLAPLAEGSGSRVDLKA